MPRIFFDTFSIKDIEETIIKKQSGPFQPIPGSCSQFSEKRGIYFWYMSTEGFNTLSKYLNIPLTPLPETIKLGNSYLIYTGTAGVRKTKGVNSGHLRQRLEWHILTKHSSSVIKNGTLSTLRTTLGSLLAEDLIVHNNIQTETILNTFLKDNLSITYIPYLGEFTNVANSVNQDEKKLIQTLKPLLNIKLNSNAREMGHPTNLIKCRRMMINKSSKEKIKSL